MELSFCIISCNPSNNRTRDIYIPTVHFTNKTKGGSKNVTAYSRWQSSEKLNRSPWSGSSTSPPSLGTVQQRDNMGRPQPNSCFQKNKDLDAIHGSGFFGKKIVTTGVHPDYFSHIYLP